MLNTTMLNILNDYDREQALNDYNNPALSRQEKREIVAWVNINYARKVLLPKICKKYGFKMKVSDQSHSCYITRPGTCQIRVSDHSLGGRGGWGNERPEVLLRQEYTPMQLAKELIRELTF